MLYRHVIKAAAVAAAVAAAAAPAAAAAEQPGRPPPSTFLQEQWPLLRPSLPWLLYLQPQRQHPWPLRRRALHNSIVGRYGPA